MTRRRHPSHAGRTPGKGSYPSPDERLRIIARRDELSKALIDIYVRGQVPGKSELSQLVAEYGGKEVLHVSAVFRRHFEKKDFLIDEPAGYRHYRLGFARFGGKRRLLSKAEQEELSYERAILYGRREYGSKLPLKLTPREQELNDLLQMDWQFWEDITPPDIPPRPADYPAPAIYPEPAAAVLAWGWDLDPARCDRESAAWQGSGPLLEQMLFDESLLEGLPGESASWAPWHALHLLGALHAHTSARRLVELFDRPNDWLSDCLPHVWAQMGPAVEPILWDILDDPACKVDQRGLSAGGLQYLVQNQTIPRLPAVQALADRLQLGRKANPFVNAYIVFVLNELQAVEVKDSIRLAFKKGKVDTGTIEPGNIDFLDE